MVSRYKRKVDKTRYMYVCDPSQLLVPEELMLFDGGMVVASLA